ncbi:MAG TPA: hypothetical protein VLB44_16115, partial [Kofleriaceae bacterium]|nr:hypothetical protein [Kofleriaceae bacterium]
PLTGARGCVARRLLYVPAMRVLALIVIAATGCTGDSDGSVTGQTPGGSFDLADTISAAVTYSDGGDTSSEARIILGSTASLCGDASASPPIDRKLQRFISIGLRDVNGATKTTPSAPGSFTIYPDTGTEPAKSASLVTGGYDGTCQPLDDVAAQAQSGTVTLTAITGGVYAGSFDVTLNTGGHITGTFDPSPCPQLATALTSTDQHSCL